MRKGERRISSVARVTFTINGRSVEVAASVPNGTARLDELLPPLRVIDDHLIRATITEHAAAGQRVSCRKGCSACCRMQPVPVTPPEAYALARLIESLPEGRRRRVRAGFATAVERLRTAGLYSLFMRRTPAITRQTALDAVRHYMRLSLACPFLLDDACSIYADRPFVCRQYLVTSPAELCVAPLDKPVKPVKTPAPFATALLKTAEALIGRAQYTVPLVLALDCAENNREELARTHDLRDAFMRVISHLTDNV